MFINCLYLLGTVTVKTNPTQPHENTIQQVLTFSVVTSFYLSALPSKDVARSKGFTRVYLIN